MLRYLFSYIVILWVLLLAVAPCNAQHQYDVWQFGIGATIDFHTNPPVVSASGGPTRTFEGSAMYCDASGTPVITCDGRNIYDRNGNVMQNGFGILGGDSTSAQSSTIVPWPCSPTKFIIINTDLFGYIRNSVGSHYSVVDLSQNGGLGSVTQKNVPLNDSTNELCCVVHYGVGPDYWVILHSGFKNWFYAYRISSSGVTGPPVISQAGFNSEVGYLKATSDGKKLIMTSYFELYVQLFDFDPMTGVVSNPINLYTNIRKEPHAEFPYGACFSPDNSKAYFSVEIPQELENTKIYQVDMAAGSPQAIIGSIYCISDSVTPAGVDKIHYGMELGPDGKIYVSTTSIGISVIDAPNLSRAACSFIDSKYILATPSAPYRNAGVPNNIGGKAKIVGVDIARFITQSGSILFTGDTIPLCASKSGTVKFTTFECDSIPVISQRIIGLAPGDYSIFDTTIRKVGSDFQVTITFAPKKSGLRSALYELVLAGGDTVRITLLGVGGDSAYSISAKRVITPFGDSAALCGNLIQQFIITSAGCNLPAVVFQSIAGGAPGEFAIAAKAPNHLTGSDQIMIVFSPTSLGTKSAVYQLVLADGKTFTIPLTAKGINTKVTLKLSSPTLFSKDSLALCDFIQQKIILTKSICSIVHVVSQTITGIAAADYSITKSFFDSLWISNELQILFHPSAVGKRTAVYTAVLDDGETITIPLSGSGINQKNTINLSDRNIFSQDSLSLCDSTELTVHIRISGCGTLNIASQSLGGNAAGDYTVISSPTDSLTTDNILTIRFHPSAFGKRDAAYTIVYDDGRTSTILLEGTGINGNATVKLSQPTLFASDSLDLCDSVELTVSLSKSGCGNITIFSQSLSGNNPGDYTVISKFQDTASTGNTLKIRFHPKAFGNRDASYVIKFDDSKTITIPLLGTGINGATTVTFSETSLFDNDSLTLCDSTEHSMQFALHGCGILHVTSQTITGPAASEYDITASLDDSVLLVNTLNIRFHPAAFGVRNAIYTVTFENGKTIDIPLSGVGISPKPLTLQNPPSFTTQIIGGDIHVPITVHGLDRQLPVELTVHFSGRNLVYEGSHSLSGIALDIAGTTTSTSSRILIPASEIVPDSIIAYSDFNVFVDTEEQSVVAFDSLDVISPLASCLYTTQTSVSTTIDGPSGCSITAISDYLRYTTMPAFQAYPNPSNGHLTLTASRNTGDITIRICDALGRVCHIEEASLMPQTPLAISLDCPSGLYVIWLKGVNYSVRLPLVMQR